MRPSGRANPVYSEMTSSGWRLAVVCKTRSKKVIWPSARHLLYR